MYKISYNLVRINQYLAIDVTMYIHNEETLRMENMSPKMKENSKTIRKYNIDGNTYIKFNPRPYIDMIIDPDIKDRYDPYKRVRCNKFDIYKLIRSLEKMSNIFKTMTDLFYYYGDKLILDDNKMEKATMIIPLHDRTLKIVPTIILDVDTNKQHEGIIIYVNTEAVSCPLTYLEMEFLLHILKTTDIDSLATSLYMMDGNIDIKMENGDNIQEPNPEVNTELINSDNTKTYATPKNGNTIPDI